MADPASLTIRPESHTAGRAVDLLIKLLLKAIVADYFRSHGRPAEEQVFALSAMAAYRWVQRKQ